MKLLLRILALLIAAVGSVLAAQYAIRRLYHRWHGRDLPLEDEPFDSRRD